jgi:hypothetical protein
MEHHKRKESQREVEVNSAPLVTGQPGQRDRVPQPPAGWNAISHQQPRRHDQNQQNKRYAFRHKINRGAARFSHGINQRVLHDPTSKAAN